MQADIVGDIVVMVYESCGMLPAALIDLFCTKLRGGKSLMHIPHRDGWRISSVYDEVILETPIRFC